MTDPIRILTAREASALLGLTPGHVGRLAKWGAFPGAEKKGGVWIIPEAAVLAWRDSHHPHAGTGRVKPRRDTYRVRVELPDGRRVRGTLTTQHSASSYGHPVLVVNGVAYGTVEAAVVAAAPTGKDAAEWARETGYVILPG